LSRSAVSLAGILAVLGLLSAAAPARALDIGPCTADFKQYCGHITPGGGRMVPCYEENKTKMSQECRSWAEGAKMNAQPLRAACSDVLANRCRSEEGDPFALLDCLQSNYIDLPVKCRDLLNEFKGRYPKPVQ
jgi:hypothetical protein